ncbi:MerR family transcriptional regulator [Bacillus sp. 1P06AnD]|uniref:MerR family transcriptional regulator n=1 Tax=Bacillus sp. 1P06AnD TaxID=3132208 RepID=UPI0039A2DA88
MIDLYRISELAALADISVRTLHHYDAIGLLKPDTLTESGYRLYSADNLATLQQILFFKEIGFPLQEIKAIIHSPSFDREKALHQHRELLEKKVARLQSMISTIDLTLDHTKGETAMSEKELFKGFSMKEIEKHQKKYRQEAIDRYGEEAITETEKKTNSYQQEDWQSIQHEMEQIYFLFVKAMPLGHDSTEAQTAASEWRKYISGHFYDCTLEIFRGLADLYVDDERFTANIDRYQKGLAAFMKNAIVHYCNECKQ